MKHKIKVKKDRVFDTLFFRLLDCVSCICQMESLEVYDSRDRKTASRYFEQVLNLQLVAIWNNIPNSNGDQSRNNIYESHYNTP